MRSPIRTIHLKYLARSTGRSPVGAFGFFDVAEGRGLEKEVPNELSRCGKKKPPCVPVCTHGGFDKRCYRQVTIPVDALRL